MVALDLTTASDGNPVIPENSHGRSAHQAAREGARVLRRSYSYSDGANITAERWRHDLELDAGLIFVCRQRDLRSGIIKIFDKMWRFDGMNHS